MNVENNKEQDAVENKDENENKEEEYVENEEEDNARRV